MARPEHEPTVASRRRVTIGAGSGMSHEALALALDISRNTLEKHYGDELSKGAAVRQLEIKESIFRQAKKGNVAAARLYLQGAAQAVPQPTPGSEQEFVPPIADGLKAARDRAATTAQQGTEWAGVLQRKQLQ